MFSSNGCYKRINKIHKRSFILILTDNESSFDSLLSTLNEKAIRQHSINVLLTEVGKYLNGCSPDLINEVFYLRQSHYNLRNFNIFGTYNPRNNYFLNFSVYRAKQLWQALPSEIKCCVSSQLSKDKIKIWRCDRFQCQICSIYIANVGYFQLAFSVTRRKFYIRRNNNKVDSIETRGIVIACLLP